MRRNQLLVIAAALLGLALIVWFVLGMTRSEGNQDKLRDDQLNRRTEAAADPEKRCGAQGTYDLVKTELFRQAAATRGSDAKAFDSLAAYAAIRVDAPVLKRHDEEIGTILCSGRVALDLPPGVAVVGGRRTLAADLDYAIQPAADGTGDVVTLSGAEGITVPLATLARTAAPPPAPADTNTVEPSPAPGATPAIPASPAPVAQPPPAPTAPAEARARPSFDCGYARTRGETAVCRDSGLAALDRQMASQYGRAFGEADAEQRALLQQTRTRFLRYRDGCTSDGCIASAYRGRMREIGDIMAGRWVAPR